VCAAKPVERKRHNPVTYWWITSPVVHSAQGNACPDAGIASVMVFPQAQPSTS
jgi:hypothetical protein